MRTDQRLWWVLGAILFGGVLLKILSPVLMPFAVAAGLAYMGDPLADRIEARNRSRTFAVVTVFVGLSLVGLLILLITLPLLLDQLQLLVVRLEHLVVWLQHSALPMLREQLNLPPEAPTVDAARQVMSGHWSSAGNILFFLWQKVSGSSVLLLAWIANLTLIPVVTFYLLRDWDILIAAIRDLLPRQSVGKVGQIARECDEVLGAFARGQLLVMAALSLVYVVGLWMVGLDLALVLGLMAGLSSIVPYLGVIVGVIASGVAAYFQFDGLLPLLGVGLVFGVGQLLEGMWLTPTLVGEKIGLHPVAVIFAVLAGGQLFGFLGVLLALPVTAVIKVMISHAGEFYLHSDFYGAGKAADDGAEPTSADTPDEAGQ